MGALAYEEVKTWIGSIPVAAGTAETISTIVDMTDFDELEYEIFFGDCASGSVITMTPKENTANSSLNLCTANQRISDRVLGSKLIVRVENQLRDMHERWISYSI